MANLLVTGGAGFIGVNFVRYWIDARPDDRVVVLDALTYAGRKESLSTLNGKESFLFVHGDIRDFELVVKLLGDEAIDTVVHFAAETHVDRSIHSPAEFVSTNIVGTHTLLEAAREVWLNADSAPGDHRFHHVSTDEVYGSLGPDDPKFTEATPYAPNSPYAASKAASDHLVRAYHRTYGLQTTVSNCSNNYGPFQFAEKLVPLTVINAVRGLPLPIYGDGSNIRDWLYVQDHVRAIEAVLDKGAAGESYNVGGNQERRNIDIVQAICTSLDERFGNDPQLRTRYPEAPASHGGKSESLIRFVPDRPGHDWRYATSGQKIASELGFRPAVDLMTGIESTIEWILANADWWQSVVPKG